MSPRLMVLKASIASRVALAVRNVLNPLPGLMMRFRAAWPDSIRLLRIFH